MQVIGALYLEIIFGFCNVFFVCHYAAVYNFVAKDEHQLSLQFGDLVQVVERCPGG